MPPSPMSGRRARPRRKPRRARASAMRRPWRVGGDHGRCRARSTRTSVAPQTTPMPYPAGCEGAGLPLAPPAFLPWPGLSSARAAIWLFATAPALRPFSVRWTARHAFDSARSAWQEPGTLPRSAGAHRSAELPLPCPGLCARLHGVHILPCADPPPLPVQPAAPAHTQLSNALASCRSGVFEPALKQP
jgi:hypothetical protein